MSKAARVHSSSPTTKPPSSPRSLPPAVACTGEQKKVFTVWMKSLVFNGHGCTVYDSDGGIVYRVDNYGSARCGGAGGVCLMDLHGTVVLNIVKRRLMFGRWEGYRRCPGQKPWFTVTRPCSPFRRRLLSCEFWCDDTGRVKQYTITTTRKQQGCRVIDPCTGLAVAEAKRKTTVCGVALGEDVLSLVVEPHANNSLVIGLLLVHGLINHTM